MRAAASGDTTEQNSQGSTKCLAYVSDSVPECLRTVVPVDCRVACFVCGRRGTSTSEFAHGRRAAALLSISLTREILILLAPSFGAMMSTGQSDQRQRLKS